MLKINEERQRKDTQRKEKDKNLACNYYSFKSFVGIFGIYKYIGCLMKY